MRVKITADSTCDLPESILEDLGVEVIPLYITKRGNSYKDMLEIKPPDIFSYSSVTGQMCKTSAVSIADYLDVFSRLLERYDAVVHISLSSKISCSYQNALIASRRLRDVYVVDSENLSSGSAMSVIAAAKLAKNPRAVAGEIVDNLSALIPRVRTSFVINTLEYLRKGGRCSTVAELGANLLKIKPCIEVVGGSMRVGKKYRGAFASCVEHYIEDRLKGNTDLDHGRIFITHTGCDAEVVNSVRRKIRQYAPYGEVVETVAGCTISSHCGPNTLGIIYLTK